MNNCSISNNTYLFVVINIKRMIIYKFIDLVTVFTSRSELCQKSEMYSKWTFLGWFCSTWHSFFEFHGLYSLCLIFTTIPDSIYFRDCYSGVSAGTKIKHLLVLKADSVSRHQCLICKCVKSQNKSTHSTVQVSSMTCNKTKLLPLKSMKLCTWRTLGSHGVDCFVF